jgi:hypothetical protein
MHEHLVRSVLRILAILFVFVGCALVAITIISMWGIESVVRGPGTLQMQSSLILAQAMVSVFGLLLYWLSSPLARRVVS